MNSNLQKNIKSNSPKILFVEDCEVTRTLVETLFAIDGVKVLSAANGVEALNLINNSNESDIDLMLMDLSFPGGTPEKIISSARNKLGQNLPIVICSGSDYLNERANSLGVKNCVSKPYAIESLLKKVLALCPKSNTDH